MPELGRIRHFLFSRIMIIILMIAGALIPALLISFRSDKHLPAIGKHSIAKDSIASKRAFLKVYRVLISARCMNCHPSGDVPLQGDDSHLHLQGVKRGVDGRGLYALKCANCHQSRNIPGLHMPPGNPNWHLPPADMKMVFQGKSAHELALQLLDKNKNGHKSTSDLIDHVAKDSLVIGAWNPADGLAKPPVSHAEFVKALKEWIDNGAVSP